MQNIASFFSHLAGYGVPAAIAVGIYLIFHVLTIISRRKIFPFIEKKRRTPKSSLVFSWLRGFLRPLSFLLKIYGISCAILVFISLRPDGAPSWVEKVAVTLPRYIYLIMRIAIVITIAWGLIESNNISEIFMQKTAQKSSVRVGKSVSRFLSAIFNFIVVAFAAVIVITELGYDVSALITGLGLGGLTIALAAKDSAANFFGGLVLVSEKPFEIGDWITFDDVEGTVEDINIRSTKIRTGPGSLTIVPNATLSNANITNWSGGMERRRANFKIALVYNTPKHKLEAYLADIQDMLQQNEKIIEDSIMVRLADLADSCLAVQIMFDTDQPAFKEFMRVKEDVNYNLIELAQKNKVEFAYPTQTIKISPETK